MKGNPTFPGKGRSESLKEMITDDPWPRRKPSLKPAVIWAKCAGLVTPRQMMTWREMEFILLLTNALNKTVVT